MKLRHLLIGIALPIVSSTTCYASSRLNLALASEMAAIDYAHTNSQRGSQWGFGALYNDSNNSSLAFVSFNVIGQSSTASGVQTGLGLKAVVHDTFQAASSLALGGKLRYGPAAWSGLGVEGGLYFAPSMLNTNDAEQYFEFLVRLTYSVNQQARVFAGWQSIDVKYKDAIVQKVELDHGLNIGFSLSF